MTHNNTPYRLPKDHKPKPRCPQCLRQAQLQFCRLCGSRGCSYCIHDLDPADPTTKNKYCRDCLAALGKVPYGK